MRFSLSNPSMLLIGAAILGIILFFQNLSPVTVNILFWHPSIPQSVTVLIILILGMAAGAFGFRYVQRHWSPAMTPDKNKTAGQTQQSTVHEQQAESK
jgi:hypothetical protein